MNISSDLVPNLRSLLSKIDALRDSRAGSAAKIPPADAAARRIQEQIAGLDADIKRAGDTVIPSALSRLAQLIAGSGVAQPDPEAVEKAATRVRLLRAQRQQCTEDLNAVQGHAAALRGEVAAIEQKVKAAEGVFLEALADAALDAYKRDAKALITEHMPQMHSIVAALRAKTGKGPPWEAHVFTGTKIGWYEKEIKRPTAHHQPVQDYSLLWPREGSLQSGAPIVDPALVEALTGEIRAGQV